MRGESEGEGQVQISILKLQHFFSVRVLQNYREDYAVLTLVGKKLNKQEVFFLDVFTSNDAVFHGLSSGMFMFIGNLLFY